MKNVHIIEVGPRDGLQNEKHFIATDHKIAWINQLSDCGYQTIEVTSFVSPQWVPQMADHTEVFRGTDKNPQVRYSVLVPNIKGLQAALTVGVKEIAVFVAASETFSQKNTNCSIAESFERLAPVFELAKQHQLHIRGYVSCIVNCPYEGKVSVANVIEVAQKLLELGCYEVSLGDTTGKATPEEIRILLKELTQTIPANKLAGHFHDTSGHALDNIQVAFDEFGITTFDASLAGIGGCPYAPGAKGNVATEKVVQYFTQRGIATGINWDKLIQAKEFIQQLITSN